MKKVLKIIGWVLAALIIIAGVAWFGFLKPEPPPISLEDRAKITLMPLPAELKLGNGVFVLNEALSHEFTGESGPRLEATRRIHSDKMWTFGSKQKMRTPGKEFTPVWKPGRSTMKNCFPLLKGTIV